MSLVGRRGRASLIGMETDCKPPCVAHQRHPRPAGPRPTDASKLLWSGGTHPVGMQAPHANQVSLEFQAISYSLAPQRQRWAALQRLTGATTTPATPAAGKQLLSGVSGTAHAGRLFAVLGPSGAGKSTLLSVLAGEAAVCGPAAGGRLSGRVLLGGRPRALSAFRRNTAHVKQDDVIMPTVTPAEALAFAAALRLPSTAGFSHQQRAAAVRDLLEGMKLADAAHTLVGDARDGIKGLSGGERRRLAVAVELLGARRQLVLADEPTSGQDSATAVQVMTFIKQLVTGRSSDSDPGPAGGILVVTLHQPGRELTALLDDLLLLAPGGKVAFSGRYDAALAYFEQQLGLAPPPLTGVAEWFLTLLDNNSRQYSCAISPGGQQQVTLDEAWAAFAAGSGNSGQAGWQQQQQQLLAGSADTQSAKAGSEFVLRVVVGDEESDDGTQQHPAADQAPAVCMQDSAVGGSDRTEEEATKQQAAAACTAEASSAPQQAALWVQTRVLAGRSLMFWWRSPAMIGSEAIQYLFVVCFLGSLYPRLATSGQAAAVDRLAALFMWLTALLVTAPSRALVTWDLERRLLQHELAAGLYSLTPFLIGSKLLIALPLECGLVAAAGSLLYLLLGLQASAAKFGVFIALSILCALCANNAGNIVGLLVPDLNLGLPALCVAATLLLSFAGFIVQAVPVWWGWAGRASFCTYAYAGLVRNEFEGLALQLDLAEAGAATAELSGGAAGAGLAAIMRSLGAGRNSSGSPHATASLHSSVAALAAGASVLTVDGLSVVPSTINVSLASDGGFIGIMAAFLAGTTTVVLLITVLLVRLRHR